MSDTDALRDLVKEWRKKYYDPNSCEGFSGPEGCCHEECMNDLLALLPALDQLQASHDLLPDCDRLRHSMGYAVCPACANTPENKDIGIFQKNRVPSSLGVKYFHAFVCLLLFAGGIYVNAFAFLQGLLFMLLVLWNIGDHPMNETFEEFFARLKRRL